MKNEIVLYKCIDAVTRQNSLLTSPRIPIIIISCLKQKQSYSSLQLLIDTDSSYYHTKKTQTKASF